MILITRRTVNAVTGEPWVAGPDGDGPPIRFEHDYEFRLAQGRVYINRSLLAEMSFGAHVGASWDGRTLTIAGRRFRKLSPIRWSYEHAATFCEIGCWLPVWTVVYWCVWTHAMLKVKAARLQIRCGVSPSRYEGLVLTWRVLLGLPLVVLTDHEGLRLRWREFRKARGLVVGTATAERLPWRWLEDIRTRHGLNLFKSKVQAESTETTSSFTMELLLGADDRMGVIMGRRHPPQSHPIPRGWCPVCEPLRDPLLEVLDTRYCPAHLPSLTAADNALVKVHNVLLTEHSFDACAQCQAIERAARRSGEIDAQIEREIRQIETRRFHAPHGSTPEEELRYRAHRVAIVTNVFHAEQDSPDVEHYTRRLANQAGYGKP